MHQPSGSLAALDVFVGEWALEPRFDDVRTNDGGARVMFEWLSGHQFLIERWSVPVPEAPDGIAIIGVDPSTEGGYVQHYFDARGVARIYRMLLADNVWTLRREQADYSPLDFRQRYAGKIADDGQSISGTWEICHDGVMWERDFDLSYRKLS